MIATTIVAFIGWTRPLVVGQSKSEAIFFRLHWFISFLSYWRLVQMWIWRPQMADHIMTAICISFLYLFGNATFKRVLKCCMTPSEHGRKRHVYKAVTLVLFYYFFQRQNFNFNIKEQLWFRITVTVTFALNILLSSIKEYIKIWKTALWRTHITY